MSSIVTSEIGLSVLDHPPAVAKARVSEYVPILDGLRGVSISLVLLSHLVIFDQPSARVNDTGNVLGKTGVSVFFVISGYLITALLLREEDRNGRISLRRFYARRFLRIFPAAYVFLGVILALKLSGLIWTPWHSFWASVLYVRNLTGQGHETSHLWSLGLEEQFYLLWPSSLVLLRPKKRLAAVTFCILAVCVWRSFLVFTGRIDPGVLQIRTDVRIDTILVGCALALIIRRFPRLRLDHPRWARWWFPAACSVAILLCALANPQWMHFGAIQTTTVALLIAFVMLWFLHNSGARASAWLKLPIALAIGRLSYSLYLWQPIVLGPREGALHALRWFPLNIALTFLFASASYFLVERPVLRLKDLYFKA